MFTLLSEVLLCIIDALLLYFFVSRFLKTRYTFIVPFRLLSILILALCTHQLTYIQLYSSFSTLINGFLIIIFCLVVFEGNPKNKILLGTVFYVFLGLLSAFILTLMSILFNSEIWVLMDSGTPTRLIVCFIVKLLAFITIIVVDHFKKDEFTALPSTYWWTFISLFFVSFIGILIIFELTRLSSTQLGAILLIILTFILLTFNVTIYILFQKTVTFFSDKSKLNQFLTHQHLLEEHIHAVEKNHQEIRKMRHDMLNHYTVIDYYLRTNQIHECQSYISQLKTSLNQVPLYYHTGNDIVDLIINQKIYACQGEYIDFNIQAYLPTPTVILATDLCVVLSNLMDNAIEAVLELPPNMRQISVKIHPHQSKLLLDFSNTVSESPIENGTLKRRSKKNPLDHGYGLLNVSYVVEKYNGYMHYTCDNNLFSISLLIDYL